MGFAWYLRCAVQNPVGSLGESSFWPIPKYSYGALVGLCLSETSITGNNDYLVLTWDLIRFRRLFWGDLVIYTEVKFQGGNYVLIFRNT